MNITELEEQFAVKESTYTQLFKSDVAYLYARKFNEEFTSYEVFERRIRQKADWVDGKAVPISGEFKVAYPKDGDAGVWMWSTSSYEKAIEKFNQLNAVISL